MTYFLYAVSISADKILDFKKYLKGLRCDCSAKVGMDGNGEDFSVFVSQTLNTIGYNSKIIQQRRGYQKYMEQTTNINNTYSGFTIAVAGSKREGVTRPLESDTDIMMIFDEVICTEEDNDIHNDWRNTTVFKMEFEDTSPGYTFLRLDRHGGRMCRNVCTDELARVYLQNAIETVSIQSESGNKYISSDALIELWSSISSLGKEFFRSFPLVIGLMQQTRAGPSMPFVYRAFGIDNLSDYVLSFKCQCPSIFQSFLTRKRHHGWPPQHLLQELSELDAHVVPVGDKNSATHPLEWRICFTKAEIKLMEHLNLPQIHLYILLKIFTKEVLKKCCDSMTSYIVKNVILWIVELVKEEKFRANTLGERFLGCLIYLKTCLKRNFLPNYMISKRNLLNKIDNKSKYTLLSLLDDCISEGSSCLLRSEKLREALIRRYTNQQLSVELGIRRDETEIASMLVCARQVHVYSLFTSYQDIVNQILSGNASELVQLFLQRISLEQFLEDPVAATRQWLQEFYSNLS